MSQTPDSVATARQINALLRRINIARRTRLQRQAKLDERIQALHERYDPEIEKLQSQEDGLVHDVTALVVANFPRLAAKGSRTIKLRNGEVSLRQGPASVLVEDDPRKIIERIANRHRLEKYTRTGERTLDLVRLKHDPLFVSRISGLRIVHPLRLIIRPYGMERRGIVVSPSETLGTTFPDNQG